MLSNSTYRGGYREQPSALRPVLVGLNGRYSVRSTEARISLSGECDRRSHGLLVHPWYHWQHTL